MCTKLHSPLHMEHICKLHKANFLKCFFHVCRPPVQNNTNKSVLTKMKKKHFKRLSLDLNGLLNGRKYDELDCKKKLWNSL